MTADWKTFKSNIRNRIRKYFIEDLAAFILRKIHSLEPLGLEGALKEAKINLAVLISIFRWGLIYGQLYRRMSVPFGEPEFRALYNAAIDLGWRDLPLNGEFIEVMQPVLREAMRNQKFLQVNSTRMFMILAAILLKYIPRQSADAFAVSIGFSGIEEFLYAHTSVTILLYSEDGYFKPLSYYGPSPSIAKYASLFIPSFGLFRQRLIEEHERNKRSDAIWKEAEDVTYLHLMPMFIMKEQICVVSKSTLGYFSGFGMLSWISGNAQPFYGKEFSSGYEELVREALGFKGKDVLGEKDIAAMLPGLRSKKRPDACIKFEGDAVLIEFKAGRPPRYPFGSFDQRDNFESFKSSIHKGLIQVLDALLEYRKSQPSGRAKGIVLTLHDFPTGFRSVVAKELLSEEDMSKYSEVLNDFGIVPILDFLPFTRKDQNEFVNSVISALDKESFFQLAEKKWDTTDYPELQEALLMVNEIVKKWIRRPA